MDNWRLAIIWHLAPWLTLILLVCCLLSSVAGTHQDAEPLTCFPACATLHICHATPPSSPRCSRLFDLSCGQQTAWWLSRAWVAELTAV